MAAKPLQMSLKKMRDDGYTCAITEKYNSFIKIRQDLFNFADFMALNPESSKRKGRVLVQTTTMANLSSHLKKYSEKPKRIKGKKKQPIDMRIVIKMLKVHFTLQVHAWRKLKGRWKCKVITL